MPNKEFLPKEIIFESVLLILKFQISFLAELKFEQLWITKYFQMGWFSHMLLILTNKNFVPKEN